MKKNILYTVLLSIIALTSQAATIQDFQIPGSPTEDFSIMSGKTGTYITLTTSESLLEEDNNSTLDGYLFNLETGELELLKPQPASGDITLTDSLSFIPAGFSDDGNRLLLKGNSNIASATSPDKALVVYDFSTQQYLRASVDEDNTNDAANPDDGRLSANGRYVLFTNSRSNNGNLEEKVYRRDLQLEITEVAFSSHDNSTDGFFAINNIGFWLFSPDGSQFIANIADNIVSEEDNNGVADTYLINISNSSANKLDFITDEGTALESISSIKADSSFQHLLLKAEGSLSTTENHTINETHATFDLSNQQILGLTDYLNLAEPFVRGSTGAFYAKWAATENEILIDPSPSIRIKGDYQEQSGPYIINRQSSQVWIPSKDSNGNIGVTNYLSARMRNDGVLYQVLNSETSEYSLQLSSHQTSDISTVITSDDSITQIRIINNSNQPVNNVGISVRFPHFSLTGSIISQAFDNCYEQVVLDDIQITDCRVGTIAANSEQQLTIDFSEDFSGAGNVNKTVELEVFAASLSDPDADLSDNQGTIVLAQANNDSGDDNDNDEDAGSSGGGALYWLSALLLCLARFKSAHQRFTPSIK